MNRIRLLSEDVVNKIAAGEVIERPASVIKELVENSIDAGANKINIFVRNGGKSEIKIVDNGIGMSYDELCLAVQRHATSKLKTDDLVNIKTLGFRGEALPSISSVSEFSIQSSNNDSMGEGHELSIKFGKKLTIKPIKKLRGTTITVKNLFFSTPARLKFLKTDDYELLVIKDFVKKISICNFSIQFNLFVDEKNVLASLVQDSTDKISRLRNRTNDVLGKEFFENSILINEKKESYSFFGLLGIPTFNHSNTKNQFIFINQRVIKDKSINQIFKVAYKDVIPYNRFPQIIIFIMCDLHLVDINVHPGKNEVRFKDKNKLNSYLIQTIREALKKTKLKVSTTNTKHITEKFKKELPNIELKLKENHKNFDEIEEHKLLEHNTHPIYPLGFAICQFHKNYIISQTKKGIVIVDQHAAHERIIYENIKNDFKKNSISRQILLIPVIVDLDQTIFKNIKNKIYLLDKFGLRVEIFGVNSIVVREVPVILTNSKIKQMVEDVLEELVDFDSANLVEEQINKIFSSMSCYGSIRSGRLLETDEMNELLRNIENTKFSSQCNHGRPTHVELDLVDIEKLFNRR